MSPDGRSSSPRRFRRYGRLTGVVLPLAVAAAAVSAPVLATTPGTVTTAAGTRTAVNDPRPPVTRSVAADDDEEEAAEGEEGGREQEARDEDGGDGGERTDQRGERETDRGDDGPDERGNERGDEGDQGPDDRGDQGGNQGGDQRPQQQHRDDQGGNRDDGRRDEQGDARGGREGDCVSIDSTLRRNDQEISVAVFDGRIFIGGRTLPRGRFVWHSLSGNRGYPRGVCGATVTSVGSGVWVKAITRDGRVVETHCTIQETRGKQSSCGEWKTLESRSFRSAR
ncbi:hypothetical protein [Actinacidiphila glaucinigra]|uniref:hypothetical protein n=1 Tax=Actinacidiphila glaucinigra TaxID=235986 RepID=UPI0037236D47